MAKNNLMAAMLGQELQAYFLDWHRQEGFPKIDLYVPGEHDEFVLIAYKKGYLTEEQILDVDCAIIDNCHFLLAWGNISRGMKIEIKHANKLKIPILSFLELDNIVLLTIKEVIRKIAGIN